MCDFNKIRAEIPDLTQIARGGQKVVFKGTHSVHGSIVLKLFFTKDTRAQREVDISHRIEFDCVPRIFETGQVMYEDTHTLYILEQYINGEELRKRLNRQERFSLAEAVDFLEQGLFFIRHLEDNNIVHRDIKPENIIISNNKVYFIDFGIARLLDYPSLTNTEAMGPHTPGYAAPEQFNNLKEYIDSRADLFSIGVVTYECLSGKNPYREGATSHLDILERTETITPITFQIPGDTNQQFMGLLSSLMGKYPSHRPRNAIQALDWLSSVKQTLQFEET